MNHQLLKKEANPYASIREEIIKQPYDEDLVKTFRPNKQENVDLQVVKQSITRFLAGQEKPVVFKEFRRKYAHFLRLPHALAPTKWGFLDITDMIKSFSFHGANIDIWERNYTRYVVYIPKHKDYWRRTCQPPDWEYQANNAMDFNELKNYQNADGGLYGYSEERKSS